MLDTATVFVVLPDGTQQVIDVGGGCNSITALGDCSTIFVATIGGPTKPPGFCDIDCETLQIIERPLPADPVPNGMICKGNQVWIALVNGTVVVFDVITGEFRTVQVGGGCNSILAKCNGNAVFVGTAGDPAAGILPGFCDIDCETLEVIPRPLPVPPVPNGFWLPPDDSKLWIMLQDFSILVFDCVNNQVAAIIPVGGGCNSITGTCDGLTTFVGNVGGEQPQTFFPPVGRIGPPGTGGNFTVDSFFDVTFEIEFDLGGGNVVPAAFSGQVDVQRGDPDRSPGQPTTIETEILSMNLSGNSPLGPIQMRAGAAQGLPSPGQVVGLDPNNEFFQVDSFFDITYQIEFQDQQGRPVVFQSQGPTPLMLDPDGPPITQIPFGCDWFILPPGFQPPPLQRIEPPPGFPSEFPPFIFPRCDRLCFPPPPPPKPPGVCDIDCFTFAIFDCPLPFRPIPCGVILKPNSDDVWVAMANGTVGAWTRDWNPIFPPIDVGGGCTSVAWKPDCSSFFVGTAGVPDIKPPGICDIDPSVIPPEVFENPTPGVPLPKGLLVCTTTAPCPCDFNLDSVVNIDDLLGFLAAWFLFSPLADFNGNGVTNIDDLLGFLSCWFIATTPGAVCP